MVLCASHAELRDLDGIQFDGGVLIEGAARAGGDQPGGGCVVSESRGAAATERDC
jgi:hypothetical protein